MHLAGDPTRVFTKDELLRDVWGFRSRGAQPHARLHACRLRAKLRAAGDGALDRERVGRRLPARRPSAPTQRDRSAA